MSSFIDNSVWDKNGACVECGFIPFDITDKCFACNVTWEINREKSIIIDEDISSYEEMFESLELQKERQDTESIHILEDQIYRRFIKDIALNKFTNINTILLAANKIHEIIIKPNDGSWDSCRWYA